MKLIISVIFVALLLGVFVLGSGNYNVAATDKHWEGTEKAIKWIREASIKTHAESLEVPTLNDESQLSMGAQHYDAMCTECHLAPGKDETEMAMGIYPKATVFHELEPVQDETEMLDQAKKYFWVMKNGIKMTAMPAWGTTHDDDVIWAMVAFVKQLQGMTAEQYAEHISVSDGHDHDHGSHDH